jgi:hypothetical protein
VIFYYLYGQNARRSVSLGCNGFLPTSPTRPTVGLSLRRFQPRQFFFELKAQLGTLIVWQPGRHPRKNGPVERDRRRLSGKLFCRSRLRKNFVQPRAHLVRVWAVRRHRLATEQIGLGFVVKEIRFVAVVHCLVR